ncbi:hypothetical protein FRC00_004611 [Tulasnella sp. 408]|nr:hypothetical protein FRC00_004611 [Tulasnella sp. 408]
MSEHALSNLMPVILELRVRYHSLVVLEYWLMMMTSIRPLGILDALHGTSKSFKKIMKEAQARHDGDYNKASQEVMSQLAQWEVEKEERERRAIYGEN